MSTTPAPEHLSPASRRMWRELTDLYELSDAPSLSLLLAALEAPTATSKRSRNSARRQPRKQSATR